MEKKGSCTKFNKEVMVEVVRASVGRYGRLCWAFSANGNGQPVTLAAEFTGNFLGQGLRVVAFSEGSVVVR